MKKQESILQDLSSRGEGFVFDRRKFLKMSAATGLAGAFLNVDQLLAQGVCARDASPLDITGTQNEGAVELGQDTSLLHYFIDGIQVSGSGQDLPSRGNIAVFVNRLQTESSFVERVLLTDSQLKTWGVRYLDSSMKLKSSGHVPYIFFNNIELNYNETYYVFVQVRQGSEVILYRHPIVNPQRSTLSSKLLPTDVTRDFVTLQADVAGILSSPLQYYTLNGIATHSAKAEIKEISSDNRFEINLRLMHKDESRDHYMRYFMVLDPVGRLLGIKRRSGPGIGSPSIDLPDSRGSATGSMVITDIASNPDLFYGSFQASVGSFGHINDCPYIHVVTEDKFDAIARNTIYLR